MSEGLACVDKAMDECRAVNKMQDDHFVSYTDYGDAQDHPWSPSALQLEAWTRVYARAIAGRPTNMSFAAKDGESQLMTPAAEMLCKPSQNR